jgi:beta-fructofuranosidase
MGALKLNVFHWHLTEDQGWRIEVEKYPELTRVGAFRKETIVGRNSDTPRKFDGKAYGGFYTKDEVREIVAHAAALNITVVPEIDMPGHCCAAIAAYPELGWKETPAEVKTVWGVYEEGVLNLKERTFEFIFDVLTEVMELFPSEYIHIGGDEAPKAMWRKDPLAQQIIKENNLRDEDELQSYFIRRIERFLNDNGRKLVGWDEILEGGLAPNAAVMSWRNENGAVEAAGAGHDAIVATSQFFYFNMYQAPEETEPFGHGGDTPLYKVYSYEPVSDELKEEERRHVIGVEGCLWTEFIKDFDYLCYMAFPRLFALAETAWSSAGNKNWERFIQKLPVGFELLKSKKINYRKTDEWTTERRMTTRPVDLHSDIGCDSSMVENARRVREILLNDPYRPGYHFAIPEGMGKPGDPNGAFFANGRYHLMYLYLRKGEKREYCWGHLSSLDLIHWRHHPDALTGGDGDAGAYSGGAFVDDDGTAYLSYWRLPFKPGEAEGSGIGIARSADRHYDVWKKLRIPSLDATSSFGVREIVGEDGEKNYLCNADPSNIWKENGFYYMLAGNKPLLDKFAVIPDAPEKYRGDYLDLFRSTDLAEWEYLHRFYDRNPTGVWTDEDEDNMCPSFLPLPNSRDGGEFSGKHLLLFISHNKGCQYYVGEYDADSLRFIPERHGRMSWVDKTFFAPEALVDESGRQIMWAWLVDNPESSMDSECWSGVFSLPRTLWLGDDGTLRMAPVPELERIRFNPKRFHPTSLSDEEFELNGVNPHSCEVRIAGRAGTASKIGLKLSFGNDERTFLYRDFKSGRLVFDSRKTGVTGFRALESAPFESPSGDDFELRVFIDKSVIDIFAGDRQAITRRIYPTVPNSALLSLFAEGGTAEFLEIDAWEISPSNSH